MPGLGPTLPVSGLAGDLAAVVLLGVVPALAAAWVYRDAKRKGSDYALNWAISVFLLGTLQFIPIFVGLGLYTSVRHEFPDAE